MIVFLDLDGVCCDFVSAALQRNGLDENDRAELLARWPFGEWSIPKLIGKTDEEFWKPINGDASFWRGLSQYPWFGSLIRKCEDMSDGEVMFATSPSRCPFAYKGKAEWLIDRGIKSNDRAMFGSKKHLLANANTVLVDDSDKNVSEFRDAGGKAILFPQVWNTNYEYIQDPMGYVRGELDKLKGGGS